MAPALGLAARALPNPLSAQQKGLVMDEDHPTVKFLPAEPGDPYAGLIERFMGMEFPQLGSGRTEDLMEAVVEEFLGTKQHRVGPRPNPESLVMIRDVVRRAVEAKRSIPILIPSAAVKVPIGKQLDVAELSALRMLCNLHMRVREHYEPGISARIRMEDLTELAISGDVSDIKSWTKLYTNTFSQLVKVLGYDKFINLVPESALAKDDEFLGLVADYAHTFEAYLTSASQMSYKELEALGWKGGVSLAMRDYLYQRYAKLYPGRAIEYPQMAAMYLASVLARRKLNAVGADSSFQGRLELSFAAPLPDAPAINTRVQYRTLPRSQSTLSQPYWNSKGFLKIGEEGQPRISLGPWDGDYSLGQLALSRNGDSVLIQADYMLED